TVGSRADQKENVSRRQLAVPAQSHDLLKAPNESESRLFSPRFSNRSHNGRRHSGPARKSPPNASHRLSHSRGHGYRSDIALDHHRRSSGDPAAKQRSGD